jgi:hypothetical protein
MNQSPNPNAQSLNPNVTPVGAGGLPGMILRRVLTVCTGGFAFPNSFVEGMDLTAIQKKTQGILYDKDKGSDSKSRF